MLPAVRALAEKQPVEEEYSKLKYVLPPTITYVFLDKYDISYCGLNLNFSRETELPSMINIVQGIAIPHCVVRSLHILLFNNL